MKFIMHKKLKKLHWCLPNDAEDSDTIISILPILRVILYNYKIRTLNISRYIFHKKFSTPIRGQSAGSSLVGIWLTLQVSGSLMSGKQVTKCITTYLPILRHGILLHLHEALLFIDVRRTCTYVYLPKYLGIQYLFLLQTRLIYLTPVLQSLWTGSLFSAQYFDDLKYNNIRYTFIYIYVKIISGTEQQSYCDGSDLDSRQVIQ